MWDFFIETRMILHIFLHFEQKHCWLLPNSYGRVSETSIYVPGENFWEKKMKKDDFLVNLYFERKNWNLGEQISERICQKSNLCVQRSSWRKQKLLKKEWFLSTSRAMRENLSYFQQKNSWTFGKKIAVCFSELHSTCPGDVFEEKHIWKRWFFGTFCALSEPFWSIGGNFLWRLTNNLLKGFRKRSLRVQGNKLKTFFGKSYGLSIFSVFWPKIYWFLGKNFGQGVSKQHSASPDEGFGDFFWKDLDFL